MARRTRVALLGAGFIAEVHLLVLRRVRGVRVVAICDPVQARVESLARRCGARSFTQLGELLEWGEVDCAHILTPPPTHRDLAAQCLDAGLHVLVEKPLAMTTEEAAQLGRLAEARGVSLGVNHNLTFQPVVLRLQKELAKGKWGPVEHLSVVHRTPLRQLDAGQFGHFMFRTEANILWEQGVHLFSLVQAFLGPCRDLQIDIGEPRRLPNGICFADRWMMNLTCEGGTAQVLMELGRAMAETRCEVFCSDGTVRLDLLRGRAQRWDKSRWPDGFDRARSALRQGVGRLGHGVGALVEYLRTQLRLGGGDPFLHGMRQSLRGFHDAVRLGQSVPAGAGEAEQVLGYCEAAAERVGLSTEEPRPAALPDPGPARPGEVVLTGGTGLLGRPVVRMLLEREHPVTLLVRHPELLPEELREAPLRVFVGDASDHPAVEKALQGASYVVHMATCAGSDPGRIPESMVQGARCVGEAAQAQGVRRMVFLSSTAALYFGGAETVNGSTPPDPKPQSRGAYARGKIAAEAEIRRLQAAGLETVVLRPAIVLGQPQHSGLGLWMRETHCLGWGTGRVSLPLVLVEDCAEAIVASIHTEGIGGRGYVLAADPGLSASGFVGELRRRTGRPYRFHSQPLWFLWGVELLKYAVKVVTRRPGREWPSWRDLRSRAFLAPLDCSDARGDLDWHPVSQPEEFLSRSIGEAP